MLGTRTLPDGTTIDYHADRTRTWHTLRGDLISTNYGPWEPAFPHCHACGVEHPGLPCDLQDDLFGDMTP